MTKDGENALLAILHLAETLNSRQEAGLIITPVMWRELRARCNEARGSIGKPIK